MSDSELSKRCLCRRNWINGDCQIHSGSSAMPREERLALAQDEVRRLKNERDDLVEAPRWRLYDVQHG